VHEGYKYKSKNQEREDILNFSLAYILIITNIFFRKRASNLLNFNDDQPYREIDFILARREDRHTYLGHVCLCFCF
jgi:hypothetical protein